MLDVGLSRKVDHYPGVPSIEPMYRTLGFAHQLQEILRANHVGAEGSTSDTRDL